MTLPASGSIRYCQFCGAGWDQNDQVPRIFNNGLMTSVFDLTIEDELAIRRCPKCIPDPRNDRPDLSGDLTRSKRQGLIRD